MVFGTHQKVLQRSINNNNIIILIIIIIIFIIFRYAASRSDHTSNKNTLTVTAPSTLPTGVYTVLCSFSGNIKIESETAVFTVYNSSVISLSSISPSETEISDSGATINMTITGTNFVDTGYVACVREEGAKLATGVFVSSTEVYCPITTFKKSALFNVSLQFGKNDPAVDSSVEFSFYTTQPSAASLAFDSNPTKLLLSLDKKAKLKSDNPQCSDFFDQGTIALFAGDSKCKLVRPKTMLILLVGGGATIKPGDSVNFTNGSLAALGEANTKFVAGTTELTVQSPQNPVVPEVEIQGAEFIGELCSYCLSMRIVVFHYEVFVPLPFTYRSDQSEFLLTVGIHFQEES